MGLLIRKARRSDSSGFLRLLVSLASFEKLEPPTQAARRRIIEDVFESHRVNLFVAVEGIRMLGYALYFYSYSSFLAKPTLYLEDIYVSENYRGRGVGTRLFQRCVAEAVGVGCARMEWAVLTWNRKAIEFYEKAGAKRMDDWYVYRLSTEDLRRLHRAQVGSRSGISRAVPKTESRVRALFNQRLFFPL